MNRGKKRKGRPPKHKVLNSEAGAEKPLISDSTRRSGRRNLSQSELHGEEEFEFDDDDDERTEKKVKLVVRLPNESDEKANGKTRNSNSEDAEVVMKMRVSGSEEELVDQETKIAEASAERGSRLESGLTTPLPVKKLLIFILDRLQKKDTYGVFSKAVDPEELPDYFEVIEKPMDFETVRKKLNGGGYSNLEEIEADVFLICSNAMQYNSSDTIYYRQARTIQEIAKRDFGNLKNEGEDGEPQPKVVRRGRPPSSKNKNKVVEEKLHESSPIAVELSIGTDDNKANEFGAYNLRKASAPYKFQTSDTFVPSSRSRFGENHAEWTSDWSDFPAHILRADMKYGKKNFTVDETRRDTYTPLGNSSSNNVGDFRRLVPIGLQDPLGYARSLARFAVNLGPTAWKFASKKIACVLPPGMKYGPGWVGENPSPKNTQQYSFSAVRERNNQAERNLLLAQQRNPTKVDHIYRNGVSISGQTAMKESSTRGEDVRGDDDAKLKDNNNNNNNITSSTTPGVSLTSQECGARNSGELFSSQQACNDPPDLNVGIPMGSPSSSSLQQPDLALQL